jgi:hypothetical protein
VSRKLKRSNENKKERKKKAKGKVNKRGETSGSG